MPRVSYFFPFSCRCILAVSWPSPACLLVPSWGWGAGSGGVIANTVAIPICEVAAQPGLPAGAVLGLEAGSGGVIANTVAIPICEVAAQPGLPAGTVLGLEAGSGGVIANTVAIPIRVGSKGRGCTENQYGCCCRDTEYCFFSSFFLLLYVFPFHRCGSCTYFVYDWGEEILSSGIKFLFKAGTGFIAEYPGGQDK